MGAPQPDLDSLQRAVDVRRRTRDGHETRETQQASADDVSRANRDTQQASTDDVSRANRDTQQALTAALDSLPSIEALAERIRLRLLDSWPAFAQTAELERELRLTIDTNLRQFFGEVLASESRAALTAPAEALRFAISVQHQGIDTAALIQAYRVGQNIAWSWWMEHLAREVTDHELLLHAIARSSERMFAYVDAVVEEQVRIWERERERWSGRLTVQRAAAVRRVLAGEAPEQAQEIEHALQRASVAGILWESPPAAPGQAPGPPMSRLELTAGAIADEVGAERTLIVPGGAMCIWAWFAIDHQLELEALVRCAREHLCEGQGLALGIPGSGLEGFRGGHRQALRARRFAELSQAVRGIVRFDEVETLCVMSEDPALLADFVERKLGALAADGRNTRRLRETVLVWLREGGNASRAAEHLRTHKNTVRNRVRRAQELIGRPLDEDRLGLELALTMVQRVGSDSLSG
jgi:sugar diacid utilization regulator